MKSKTLLGLTGAVGIWLTAGLALPFVNILSTLTPEQLMMFRGFLTAGMALIGLRGVIKFGQVDKFTWLIFFTLPFATLGLFQGTRQWGAGPTMIVLAATPFVNVAISFMLGRKIPAASLVGLGLMICGVSIASNHGHFHLRGFLWSVFGAIMSGVIYELFSQSKASSLEKCFFGSAGMGTLGLVLSARTPWADIMEPKLAGTLVAFAFVGGLLYWVSNMLTFKNLPTTEASVLAQGETPAVIVGAHFILGERITAIQWVGVFIALFGAWYVGRWLTNNKPDGEITTAQEVV